MLDPGWKTTPGDVGMVLGEDRDLSRVQFQEVHLPKHSCRRTKGRRRNHGSRYMSSAWEYLHCHPIPRYDRKELGFLY